MKRSFIFALFFAFAALSMVAETHYKPRISIGGRAGATMAKMSFTPAVKQTWTPGTTGAISFRYSEEKLFGLIAEIGWVQRGWKEDFEQLPLNYSRSLTYVNLPILTHIYFGSRRFKAFINLGPQLSYLIGESKSSNFDYNNPTSNPDFPTRNRMTEQLSADIANKVDYGICASAGGEFFIQPRQSILLEARFYFGLGNIFHATKADTFSASRSLSLEFTLGYNFRIK
ncbi:MAG: PorT family protein [Muribaculaceae bacterium]|nr:PorT family protein [Muribaculaceae bacterium]